jgi:hypothetical protein
MPLGTFCGHLVYFPHFGMLHRETSGNPAVASTLRNFTDRRFFGKITSFYGFRGRSKVHKKLSTLFYTIGLIHCKEAFQHFVFYRNGLIHLKEIF